MDPTDHSEEQKTQYILKAGVAEILRCFVTALLSQPVTLAKLICLASRIGWRSDRGVLRHLAYAIEAAVLATWCRRDHIQHLHAHFGTNPAAIAMLASQLSKIPFSFTAHGPDEFENAPRLALDEKLRRASFAICVSAFGKSQLMRWTSPDQWPKIEIIHCSNPKERMFVLTLCE